jgi:hypothetical protein
MRTAELAELKANASLTENLLPLSERINEDDNRSRAVLLHTTSRIQQQLQQRLQALPQLQNAEQILENHIERRPGYHSGLISSTLIGVSVFMGIVILIGIATDRSVDEKLAGVGGLTIGFGIIGCLLKLADYRWHRQNIRDGRLDNYETLRNTLTEHEVITINETLENGLVAHERANRDMTAADIRSTSSAIRNIRQQSDTIIDVMSFNDQIYETVLETVPEVCKDVAHLIAEYAVDDAPLRSTRK